MLSELLLFAVIMYMVKSRAPDGANNKDKEKTTTKTMAKIYSRDNKKDDNKDKDNHLQTVSPTQSRLRLTLASRHR